MAHVEELDSFIQLQKNRIEREKDAMKANNRNLAATHEDYSPGLATDDDKQRKLHHMNYEDYNSLNPQRDRLGRKADSLPTKPDTPEAGLVKQNGLGNYELRRQKLQEERKREYNELLAKQEMKKRGRETELPHHLSIPGLKDESSAKRDKINERNREYNEYLKNKQTASKAKVNDDRPVVRKGWATPTYDEVLEKKRAEENNYRRYNNPSYVGLQSARSENNINSLPHSSYQDDDSKFQELDREYWQRKSRFTEERAHRLLNDPAWLDMAQPGAYRAIQATSSEQEISGPGLTNLRVNYDSGGPAHPTKVRPDMPNNTVHPSTKQLRYQPIPVDPYGATLIIGSENRLSADQKRKAAYRLELERQMNETKNQRNLERRQVQESNPISCQNGELIPENPRRYKKPEFSPRAVMFDDGRKVHGTNILDDGFDDLYMPHSQSHPQYLNYPTSYRLPPDDPYMLYANQNPLEPLHSDGYRGEYSIPQKNAKWTEKPRVKFDDRLQSFKEPVIPSTSPYPMDNERIESQREAQRTYQEELKRQIEEQKLKKQKEKEEKDRYDRKLEEEIRKYDPFGRAGGGAPMRDHEGNVIANWKQSSPDDEKTSETANLRDQQNKVVHQPHPTAYQPVVTETVPHREADTFARGGHGIFGEPITDAEKMKRSRYQDELRQQMEERKRQQELEKLKLQAEDQKLLEKIAEDQRKIQEELEKEKRKEREKHEAALKQQEELRQQQLDRKKEEDKLRREAEERRQNERNKPAIVATAVTNEQNNGRTTSPPIPSMRSKTNPPPSPAVPANKTASRPQSRVASADVLNQLARMRHQLQSERKRVESDLKHGQDQPEISDPRLQHKPRSNVDIFEVARKRESVPVRRQTHNPPINNKNVEEFNSIRKSGVVTLPEFPQTPNTDDSLEIQQRLLLNQQEENISKLRQSLLPTVVRSPSITSAALLDSESAFIDISDKQSLNGNNHVARNDSARHRYRQRSETPKSIKSESVGSLVSLNPDEITRKNESRLRKLTSAGNDDISLASQDPDEILDRFMARQQHSRPPSEQTLIDDSWMRPGTKHQ